jgi:hypothetical protein
MKARNKNTNRIGILKADAKILRYCGYNARADFQAMQIVVKNIMFGWEHTKLQSNVESCVVVPAEYIKDSEAFAAS